jgi:type II secretory pathway pseudopilin PulG
VGGFSLVEIAVVLLIIAVLTTIVAVPLATQVEQQRISDTQRQLENIREALLGYAMANGRLPCPATSTSNGAEAFAPGGSAVNGNCSSFVGFVPSSTLGLAPVDTEGFAADAWGLTANRIRYAVRGISITAGTPAACTTTIVNPLTRTDGMKSATMGCLSDTSASVNLLTVCSTTPSGTAGASTGCASTATTITSKAPFVLFSLGKNAPTGGTGTDEAHNVDTDYVLVSHIPSTTSGNEFDDIVTWGSLNTLFARMVQAGKLP